MDDHARERCQGAAAGGGALAASRTPGGEDWRLAAGPPGAFPEHPRRSVGGEERRHDRIARAAGLTVQR
jgi:hypothetical protein